MLNRRQLFTRFSRFYSNGSKAQLSERVRSLINQERTSLGRISTAMARTNFPELKDDSHVLNFSARSLDDFFLLTIGGPYNVGKSSLINTMIGDKVLATGVTPTTDRINHIRFGEHLGTEDLGEEQVTRVNTSWLKDISIVDTPGIDSIFEEHEKKTKEFVRLSDLIFFLTSSAQAFTKTEQNFLDYCHSKEKRIVILITKKELLTPEELVEVREFLVKHFESRFGYKPEVIEVSSKMASGENYDQSGLPEIKFFIQSRLNDAERIKIKLENGIKTGLMMANKYHALCEDASRDVNLGLDEVGKMEVQATQYLEEMRRYLELNYGDIHTIMARMRERSHKMIDEYVQLTKFMILFNKSSFADKFKTEVVDHTHKDLERKIFYMTDYFTQRNSRFLESVKKDLAHRFASMKGLTYDGDAGKNGLVEKSIGEVYGKMKTPSALADEISSTMWNTVAIELAAIFGFGSAATYIPAAVLPFDPILIPTAGAITALSGLALMPYKRRSIKSSIDQKTEEATKQLREILQGHFEEDMTRNTSRIQSIVAPHRKILEDRKAHLRDICSDLDMEKKILKDLEAEVLRLT